MTPPVGAVWEQAKTEENWLLWVKEPPRKPGGKPGKRPMHEGEDGKLTPAGGAPAAARHTFAEAQRLAAKYKGGVGYLPRTGSAMVIIDLDGVVEGPELEWREDVLPVTPWGQFGSTYIEVSVSGTGLHILQPRAGWPELSFDGGRDPVGLIASGSRFCALTFDHVGDVESIEHEPELRRLLQGRIDEQLTWRAEEKAAAEAERGQGGWFFELPEGEQELAMLAMLSALPRERWLDSYEGWWKITAALREHEHLHDAWAVWSSGGAGFDDLHNETFWNERQRREGARVGIGTIIHHAGEEMDLGPLQRQARAERTARAGRRRAGASGNPAVEEAVEGMQAAAEAHVAAEERLVLYLPSMTAQTEKWFDLGVPTTLEGVTAKMLTRHAVNLCYGPGTVNRLLASCRATPRMPVVDPRLPFGFIEQGVVGNRPTGVLNRLRMRQVDPNASTDPNHPALQAWRMIMGQVFPIAREEKWMEQWVACKAREPWQRMVGVLSVATTQGTGRGGFTDVLAGLFGRDVCASVSVEDLGGSTSQWNDYLLALMVFVDELSASESTGMAQKQASRRRGYEMLKSMIDPRPVTRRINVKGGQAYQAESFSSFFIATNSEDGLPVPDEDRRIAVLQGNDKRADDGFQQACQALANDEEGLAVVWRWLSEGVSMEGFQPDVALQTDAKEAMIDANKQELDIELEGSLELLGWPLLVSPPLLRELAMHGEMGRAMAKNGTLEPALKRWQQDYTRRLPWPPKAKDKGSRNLRLGGQQHRVRVIKRSEQGMPRVAVDTMSNEGAKAWLEALHLDAAQSDLEKGVRCRAMRKGFRAV